MEDKSGYTGGVLGFYKSATVEFSGCDASFFEGNFSIWELDEEGQRGRLIMEISPNSGVLRICRGKPNLTVDGQPPILDEQMVMKDYPHPVKSVIARGQGWKIEMTTTYFPSWTEKLEDMVVALANLLAPLIRLFSNAK